MDGDQVRSTPPVTGLRDDREPEVQMPLVAESPGEAVVARRRPRRWVSITTVVAVVGLLAGLVIGSRLGLRFGRDDGTAAVRQLSANFGGDAGGRSDVIIFLEPGTSTAREAEVRDMLRADPRVDAACFFDTEDSYAELGEMFSDKPGLARGVTPEDLPTSFRLDVSGDADIEEVGADYERVADVRDVVRSGVSPQLSAALGGTDDTFTACELRGTMVIG